MASLAFTRNGFKTAGAVQHTPWTAYQCRDAIDATEDEPLTERRTASEKIHFFRSMGLEFGKPKIQRAVNINDSGTMYVERSSNARPFLVAPNVSQSVPHEPEQSPDCETRSKQTHPATGRSGHTTDYLEIVSRMRECSVMIIGDKCKVCGKTFKCIKDVQNHVRKKHRKRRSKKKLVLKIGDEVISRVLIRRKHLKWHRTMNESTIVASGEATSSCNDELSDDRTSYEGTFVDLDSDCDVNSARSILTKTNENLFRELNDMPANEVRNSRRDDDDIEVLLRITRARTSGPAMEINHETPNRTERELLISDAIREFVRMDNEPIVINDSDDIEHDCCWLANGISPNFNLDREETNCTFHIDNDDDIEFTLESENSAINGNNNNNEYFNDEEVSLNPKVFGGRIGDVLPDFLEGLDDPKSQRHFNNNVYDVDSPFYDTRTNGGNNLTGVSKMTSCDNSNFINNGSSVLIKEEIMLEDFL